MDNSSHRHHSSCPNSGNSSPLSHSSDKSFLDTDLTRTSSSASAAGKVKFMCSYGGKILPRPHDNQLSYVGGDTKILSVDRNVGFPSLLSRLAALAGDANVCFKYQLPDEDLDALISVTNDEDLEHMMMEYDRLSRVSNKPARLRLFLFGAGGGGGGGGIEGKLGDRQWFVDALNSVKIAEEEEEEAPPSATASSVENPDFLFGFDKGKGEEVVVVGKDVRVVQGGGGGSECGSEDRVVVGEPVAVSQAEMHWQRMQMSTHEQAVVRKNEDINTRTYYGDYYAHKLPQAQPAAPATVPHPYWHEPPVYLVSTPAGIYQAPASRPTTVQVGQGYYGMQGVVPEVYREQPMYNTIPQPSVQQAKVGPYGEVVGMLRPATMPAVGVPDHAQYQVGYDASGRQIYYTSQGGFMPPYQAVGTAAEMRQSGGVVFSQDGKIFGNAKSS